MGAGEWYFFHLVVLSDLLGSLTAHELSAFVGPRTQEVTTRLEVSECNKLIIEAKTHCLDPGSKKDSPPSPPHPHGEVQGTACI